MFVHKGMEYKEDILTEVIVNGVLYYEAQPRQNAFHASNAQCRMYGGAAGGGKTEAILWEIFDICNDESFRKLNGAVFRKSFPEVEEFFIKRALDKYPKGSYTYNTSKHLLTFKKTGSRVKFCYCEGDLDVTRYQGAEWDFLAIDEFTHHTEFVFKYLFGRLRTDKPNWIPLFFGGTNPGGIGHAWVKRIFVDQDLNDAERKFVWEFVPARLEDNPKMLENNPQYEDMLDLIPDPVIRKAMRWGDWNIFAGQYFSELRPDLQGYEDFEIPYEWDRFLEIDYGYDHVAVCHWNAIDPDGHIYKYKEYVCRHKTYSEFASEILKMTEPSEFPRIMYAVADPAIWAKKGNGHMSGAEEMEEVFRKKISLVKADNDRIVGWGIMREWLKPMTRQEEGQTVTYSRMHIALGLTFWWKTVPQLQRNPKKPEDVLKATMIRTDGQVSYADDPGDATRYGVMSRPMLTKPKKKEPETDRYGMPKAKVTQHFRPANTNYKRPEWNPGIKPQYHGYDNT